MNISKRTLNLTQLGIFTAIILLMTLVPFLGYIPLFGISITIIHIPVIVGAVTLGWRGGLTLGAVWGISCWIKALVAPPSPFDQIFFTNPLVSVLPRIIVGIAAALVFIWIAKLDKSKLVAAGMAAIAGTLTNTVLVLSSLFVFCQNDFRTEIGKRFLTFFMSVLGANGVPELIAAVVLVIPISKAIFIAEKRLKKNT